jgi:hypothetical protein
MDRVMCADNRTEKEALESSISADDGVEFQAHELTFKSVWQQPVAGMQTINQFMEEINIYDDTDEYGDRTPSDIMALLSSSFPSGIADSDKSNDEPEQLNFAIFFAASTPYSVQPAKDRSSTAKKRDRQVIKDFNDISPVVYSSNRAFTRDNRVLTRKRLQMSFEYDENDKGECNDPKIMKL